MKKQILSFITATALTLTSTFTAFAVNYGEEYQALPTPEIMQTFSDVSTTHWAFEYIGEMAQRGVVSGYPDGRFLPENQVTRAEFAKIMVSAAGLRVENNGITSFTDVYTTDWYCPYIECARDYLTGYSTSSGMIYKPTTPALREDIAVALVKLKGYDVSLADESVLNMFTDSYSISSEARKYVAVAVERGIVSGYEDNTFKGQATISRAEAATLLWRAFQYGNDNKVTDNSTNPTGTETSSSVPMVKTTPEPMVKTTPKPMEEPTEEPEPTETPKPYKVDTLVKARLDGDCIFKYTRDNDNNIYYVDNGVISRVSVPDGDTEKIFDTADLDINDEEKTLSDFSVGSLFYDTHKNQLMICGDYESINSANNVGYGTYLYVINEDSAELVTDKFNAGSSVYGVLSNGDYICDYYTFERGLGVFILDGETFQTDWQLTGNRFGKSVKVCDFIESDSDIYYFTETGGFTKYDYTNQGDSWSAGDADAACILNDKVICLNGYGISTYNLKGKKLSEINYDNLKVLDKTELRSYNACEKLISIDNNIVFYDTSAKAFRIISENN